MERENLSWVDELVGAEPEFDIESLPESAEEKFLSQYKGVEDVWRDVSSRDHQDSSFRMPFEDDDSMNCLGRTLMVGLYEELSEGSTDGHITVYFDDKFAEDGTVSIESPHVTATVEGTEYGSIPGYDTEEELGFEALSDLYKVGLGIKQIDGSEDIDNLSYEQLEEWGNEIKEKYSDETSGSSSEYMRRQGYAMSEEASEGMVVEEMSEESTDFYVT